MPEGKQTYEICIAALSLLVFALLLVTYSSRGDYRAAIYMDNNNSHSTADDPYNLTESDFSEQISGKHAGWRTIQVKRVLTSFEEAKMVMSTQAIREIHEYLKSGMWIRDDHRPSKHITYNAIKRKSRGSGGSMYYPFFFVFQAIFPSTKPLRVICDDVGRHWDARVSKDEPFYPRLDDSKKELDLIKGKDPDPPRQDEHPSQSQDTPAVFTPTHGGKSEMEDQNDGIQVATGTACTTSQPVPISASDPLRNYDEEQANFRSEPERRFAEVQAQMQQDAIEP
ncbi:hypothetical protein FBULB1_5976 [Fusarium bulbicola]|nr:hypothetical protein FBULB1_5976 [Fusarium bulbicola]